jgi:hypothetical protein
MEVTSNRVCSMRAWTLVFGVLVALASSAASFASLKTTAPVKKVAIYVSITDKGISMLTFASVNYTGTPELVVANTVMRGQRAVFIVRNLGKKPHDFAVLGKRTRTLSPKGKAYFVVNLVSRGAFPFESTLDKGKSGFRGLFTVG